MNPNVVLLKFDADSLRLLCDEAAALVSKVANLFPEIRDDLVAFFEADAKLFELKNEPAAADQFIVRAYPSDRFTVLLAALRADEIDIGAIRDALNHRAFPSAGCVEAPADAESPVARKGAGGEAAANSGDNNG